MKTILIDRSTKQIYNYNYMYTSCVVFNFHKFLCYLHLL